MTKSIQLAIIQAFTALWEMKFEKMVVIWNSVSVDEKNENDKIYTIGYYLGFYSSLKAINWANGGHFDFWSGF